MGKTYTTKYLRYTTIYMAYIYIFQKMFIKHDIKKYTQTLLRKKEN